MCYNGANQSEYNQYLQISLQIAINRCHMPVFIVCCGIRTQQFLIFSPESYELRYLNTIEYEQALSIHK